MLTLKYSLGDRKACLSAARPVDHRL